MFPNRRDRDARRRRHARLRRCLARICILLTVGGSARGAPPMGTAADVAYAGRVWDALAAEKLVGPHSHPLRPFFGGAKPHGTILEVAYQDLTVAGHTGFVVVKRNYDGPGVSVDAVSRDRRRFLSSVTVMFRREKGYDPDNQDWFWVKYRPDGRLFERSTGRRKVAMAGRIVKGATPDTSGGCIYCHASAGGGDYVFYPEIRVPGYSPPER